MVGDVLTTGFDRPPKVEDLENLPHLEGIVGFDELEHENVELILGADMAFAYTTGHFEFGASDEPLGWKTKFGWTLLGPSKRQYDRSEGLNCLAADDRLERLVLENNWQDFLVREGTKINPEESHPSQEDRYAIQQMQDTIQFDEMEGRYHVGLPWVKGRTAAAMKLNRLNSRENALNRIR